MPPSDTHINLLSEILLNKVKGWKWYYYQVDLGRVALAENRYMDPGVTPVTLTNPDASVLDLRSLAEDAPFFSQVSQLGQLACRPDSTEVFATIVHHTGHPPEALEKVVRRIFDLNKINGYSNAGQGMLGKFNERDRAIRNELFLKRIKKKGRKNLKVILAEGDSWFQFPRIYFNYDPVKDIIDCLNKEERYAVYSQAYGGDWLSNILFLQEYVEDLPRLSPDVFLISGGGNDLVGNSRLATMVENPFLQDGKKAENPLHPSASEISAYLEECKGHHNELVTNRTRTYEGKERGSQNKLLFHPLIYKRGLAYVREEFFQFLNVVMVQYFLFVKNIRDTEQYPNMKIIAHGYDFVIPKKKKGKAWYQNPLQAVINKFNGNGDWLSVPLALKGITDEKTKEAILYFMIFEFNEMLIQLASYPGFDNLYHIDMRNLANPENGDWYDELHLNSEAYGRASRLFKKCIDAENGSKKKIYTVNDLKPDKIERNQQPVQEA